MTGSQSELRLARPIFIDGRFYSLRPLYVALRQQVGLASVSGQNTGRRSHGPERRDVPHLQTLAWYGSSSPRQSRRDMRRRIMAIAMRLAGQDPPMGRCRGAAPTASSRAPRCMETEEARRGKCNDCNFVTAAAAGSGSGSGFVQARPTGFDLDTGKIIGRRIRLVASQSARKTISAPVAVTPIRSNRASHSR